MFLLFGCISSISIKAGLYVLEKCAIKMKASTYKEIIVGWACWRRDLLAAVSKGKYASGDRCILPQQP